MNISFWAALQVCQAELRASSERRNRVLIPLVFGVHCLVLFSDLLDEAVKGKIRIAMFGKLQLLIHGEFFNIAHVLQMGAKVWPGTRLRRRSSSGWCRRPWTSSRAKSEVVRPGRWSLGPLWDHRATPAAAPAVPEIWWSRRA